MNPVNGELGCRDNRRGAAMNSAQGGAEVCQADKKKVQTEGVL